MVKRTALQDRVMIIHPNGERLEVPVRQIGLGKVPNVPLVPGDVIYVPESYLEIMRRSSEGYRIGWRNGHVWRL